MYSIKTIQQTTAAIVLLLIGFATATAQQQQMDLKQCVEFSLKNHPSAGIYNNELQIANYRANEALAGYLPKINATATFDDNIKRQTTVIPAGAFSPQDLRVQFGNQYQTNAFVQADQVIYDQSLINSIRANGPNKQLSALNKDKNDEVLIYNTMQAYYQVMVYKEQEKLLAQNEKKFTEIVNIQKLQYEKGVLKKVDFDRVRVNLNNITSQKKLAQMNLDLAMNRLKNAMGMPLENPLAIADSLNYKQEVIYDVQNDLNVKTVIDYKIQSQNILLYEIDLKRRKAQYIPTLSAYARYGALAFGNELGPSFKNWYDYSAIGLKLNISLFDGFRKSSQINQAQLSLVNMRENQKLTEQNLKLQQQNANTQLLSSFNNFTSNKENLELSKDVFDNTTLQYQNGTATLADLLNADYSYKESQTNYINSLLNYMLAKIDTEKSKGTLKQYINQL